MTYAYPKRRIGRPRIQIDLAVLRALHAQGWSTRAIAAIMGLTKSTVARALKGTPDCADANNGAELNHGDEPVRQVFGE